MSKILDRFIGQGKSTLEGRDFSEVPELDDWFPTPTEATPVIVKTLKNISHTGIVMRKVAGVWEESTIKILDEIQFFPVTKDTAIASGLRADGTFMTVAGFSLVAWKLDVSGDLKGGKDSRKFNNTIYVKENSAEEGILSAGFKSFSWTWIHEQ